MEEEEEEEEEELDKKLILLCNIYAPTKDKLAEQLQFINKVRTEMSHTMITT